MQFEQFEELPRFFNLLPIYPYYSRQLETSPLKAGMLDKILYETTNQEIVQAIKDKGK